MFYDFWSDGDLHGEKVFGDCSCLPKSGLLHFFSYIASNQQAASQQPASQPGSQPATQPASSQQPAASQPVSLFGEIRESVKWLLGKQFRRENHVVGKWQDF